MALNISKNLSLSLACRYLNAMLDYLLSGTELTQELLKIAMRILAFMYLFLIN